MKSNRLFKILLDILCFIYLTWLIAPIIFIINVGGVTINHDIVVKDIENWDFYNWFIAVVSLLTYIIFLRGLYFLRKVARVLPYQYFSDINISNSKKVGAQFLLAGTLYFSIIMILWIEESIDLREFSIGTDMDLVPSLSLMLIGTFFILQSKNLLLAKNFKDENDLTV